MKDYREVQVSTTILVFIILGILILGTVIFFMGVQVGKKQSDLLAKSLISSGTEEKVSQEKPAIPAEETAPAENLQAAAKPGTASQQVSPATQSPAETRPAATAPQKPLSGETQPAVKVTNPPPATTGGSYFVQVGAFNDLSSARLAADRFKKQGYRTVIKDPYPTDRKTVYRVWLGGYPTREEAQRVKDELVKTSVKNPGYFVVQQ
jgi:cell division septation protein DedD